MLALTPSKIRDFAACPLRYKLKHVDVRREPAPVATPALSFGNSLHAALRDINAAAATTGTSPVAAAAAMAVPDAERLLRRHWRGGDYGDAAESERHFERALAALRKYLAELWPPAGRVLGAEVYLARTFRLRGAAAAVKFGCKVDCLVLRPDDVLEAIDYKTNASGQVPTAESLAGDLPTFIYYVLARSAYPEHARAVVTYLNLLTHARVEVTYDAETLAANKEALTELVRQAEGGEFAPRPGEWYAWCATRDQCPRYSGEIDLDELL